MLHGLSVDPDLAKFLVRSKSDSIELRGLWEFLSQPFLDFARFLVRSESDSIELRGLRDSCMRRNRRFLDSFRFLV